MKRKIMTLVMAAALASSISMTAIAGQWHQDTVGWYYGDEHGYLTNQWQEIDGKLYYFDENGYMLSDTVTPDGHRVGSDGARIEETADMALTEVQKQIMEKSVSPLIYGFDYFSNGSPELKTEGLTAVQLVDLLGWHINQEQWNTDSILFVRTIPEDNYLWFDKASTVKRGGDLYGRMIEESIVANDNFILTNGNLISVVGADGEGIAFPHITSYTTDGNRLTASISYTVEYNVEELNTSGTATATFVADAGSFFGYSLESLRLN